MRDWRFGIPGPHVTKYVSKFFVFTSRFCWYSVFCNADTHRTYWGLINIDHISFTYPTYKMLYITRFYKKSLISVQNAFVSLQWRLFSYRWSTSFVEILTFAYHNINFWRIWDFFLKKCSSTMMKKWSQNYRNRAIRDYFRRSIFEIFETLAKK